MEDTHGTQDSDGDKEISLRGIMISAVLLLLAVLDSKMRFAMLFASAAGGSAGLAQYNSVLGDFDSLFCAVLCLASYLVCGKGVVLSAIVNITKGHIFDEKFLMTIASLGAVAVGQMPEAAAVMLLYQAGEYFEDKAEDRSRRSIQALMSIKADTACVKRGGKEVVVNADDVKAGDVIVVRPGERVSVDGIVTSGASFLDTAALTGESVPLRVFAGSKVMAGSINFCGGEGLENASGVIEITAEKEAKQSAAARIIALVSESAKRKSHSEKFITAFSRVYTPLVCALALLLAVVPSLITGDVRTWTYRALIFLVVSCPCALVISVPLSFVAGLGRASRLGVIIKGSQYIEVLSRAKVAVFDKTGTLTRGTFCVTAVCPANESRISADELVALAAHAETYSNHPLSRSIRSAHSCPRCNLVNIEDALEMPGLGIKAVIDGKTVLAGNEDLMLKEGVVFPTSDTDLSSSTVVRVAVDGEYAGHIAISDETKSDAAASVKHLRQAGIKKVVMLTGDSEAAAKSVAKEVGVDEVYASLLPADKVKKVEELLLELKASEAGGKRGTLLFAGDGINDAPVLTLSDAGIAMGTNASEAAIEAADAVVMTDEMERVCDAVKVSKRTMNIVMENIIFAIGVKTLIMILGALGLASLWLAVFGDTGVALLAVANALRPSIQRPSVRPLGDRPSLSSKRQETA